MKIVFVNENFEKTSINLNIKNPVSSVPDLTFRAGLPDRFQLWFEESESEFSVFRCTQSSHV